MTIRSKPANDAYRANFEKIFKKGKSKSPAPKSPETSDGSGAFEPVKVLSREKLAFPTKEDKWVDKMAELEEQAGGMLIVSPKKKYHRWEDLKKSTLSPETIKRIDEEVEHSLDTPMDLLVSEEE